jgi:hypothetical protein
LEIVQPMAAVILGGLVSTAVLTTLVTPALYRWLGARSEPDLTLVFAEEMVDLTELEASELPTA